MQERKIYPLSKVTQAIEKLVSEHCKEAIWIKAEIVKLNYYNQSGHCYPDLVEKSNGKIIAEIRGNIWKSSFDRINKKFKTALNEDLGDNMTVVLLATVKYHSLHGLSLDITDIDPSYTLGELARQKAETIQKLKDEKIYNANKETILEKIPKTIAIISVNTSKGYNDFINVIENNPWNYKYQYLLFPAVLQGDRAVSAITKQLDKIRKYITVFNAVAIIRGGGGDVGLSCYDDYQLAKSIATFPIPVLTGIGHSTNETVSELVSYRSFITPTKIGEFLLQQYHNFSVPIKENIEKINNQVLWIFERQKSNVKETARLFHSLTSRIFDNQKLTIIKNTQTISNYTNLLINNEKKELKNNANTIFHSTSKFIQLQSHNLIQTISIIKSINERIFTKERNSLQDFRKTLKTCSINIYDNSLLKIKHTEEKIKILVPSNVLKRGYSITRLNGHAIQNSKEAKIGDCIKTELFVGSLESRIEKINNNT
jgi:exodeoxyribonuclease VII large subunit